MTVPDPITPDACPSDPQRVEEFVALFTRHSSWLRGYVHSLVPNHADAEDVLQNASSVLWKRFSRFQSDTDFFAWACQVARNEVMHYRRSKGRELVRFADEFVDAVADEAVAMSGDLDHLRTVLAHCLSKLSEKDRRLVEERYRDGATTTSAAQVVGRSVAAAYKALGRVRKVLLGCVQRNWEAKSLQ